MQIDQLFSVRGKVVLVTGGSRGIGEMIAAGFLANGAKVYISSRKADACDATAARLAEVYGGECISLPANCADVAGIDDLVARLREREDHLDVLINNAGVSMITSAFQDEESYEANWATTLDVNLTAHSRLVRLALPHLRAAEGGGRVVNIASTESIVVTAGMTAYAASKAGVVGLTKSLAVELGRHNVTVNCICPGPINTGMTASIDDDAKTIYAKRRVPLRRYGDPEEVAQMTLSLCLPAASFLNGASIPVDGGMSIRHT